MPIIKATILRLFLNERAEDPSGLRPVGQAGRVGLLGNALGLGVQGLGV